MKSKKGFGIIIFALLLSLSPFTAAMPFVPGTVQAAPSKLNYTTKNILVGETFSLKPKNGKAISFLSSDPSVATVSKNGNVKGKKAGTARITVTATTGKKFNCKVTVRDEVDIIIFAGQSNMTNVGKASLAPAIKDGAGYEILFTKKKLSPLREPFGVQQKGKVTKDSGGTLASAFANAYFSQTKTPIVATNTARGATGLGQWSGSYYKKVITSANKTKRILKKQGLKIRHCYMVFFQGENDATYDISTAAYQQHLMLMLGRIRQKSDVEKCLIIRIGNNLNDPTSFNRIAAAQTAICMDNRDFVLISTIASGFDKTYYQGDGLHFTQEGLNKIGKQAGTMAGKYAKTGKEPAMKDPRYKNTYRSNCN
ncbi:MAG: Ig-like domain-containing protein [Roseburia sp.]|nr:Ig-like domain-containing protein [Roseburia sp.]MCM1280175.1 Ig-like domain-containing protein [Robinsoniella sp.]